MLLAQLAQGTFPVPAERVVIGPSIAYGMTGFEAVNVIYPRQLSNLGSGGSIGEPPGVTGAAGFDAGGLSGSAVSGGRRHRPVRSASSAGRVVRGQRSDWLDQR